MLVRIAHRKDPDQTVSSTSVQNFRTFTWPRFQPKKGSFFLITPVITGQSLYNTPRYNRFGCNTIMLWILKIITTWILQRVY